MSESKNPLSARAVVSYGYGCSCRCEGLEEAIHALALLCSTPVHSTPLHSSLLYSTLLHSTPVHSTPLQSTLLYSTPYVADCCQGRMDLGADGVRGDKG